MLHRVWKNRASSGLEHARKWKFELEHARALEKSTWLSFCPGIWLKLHYFCQNLSIFKGSFASSIKQSSIEHARASKIYFGRAFFRLEHARVQHYFLPFEWNVNPWMKIYNFLNFEWKTCHFERIFLWNFWNYVNPVWTRIHYIFRSETWFHKILKIAFDCVFSVNVSTHWLTKAEFTLILQSLREQFNIFWQKYTIF